MPPVRQQAAMQQRGRQASVKRRVSTTVVRNELRLQKWGLGRERNPRGSAHPLQCDERGLPVCPSPVTAADRLRRLVMP
jgi:hypothetical protein